MAAARLFSHPGTPSGHVASIIHQSIMSLTRATAGSVEKKQWDAQARFHADTPKSLTWSVGGDDSVWVNAAAAGKITDVEAQEGTLLLQDGLGPVFGLDALAALTSLALPEEFRAAMEAASGNKSGSVELQLDPEVAGNNIRVSLPVTKDSLAAHLAQPITQHVLALTRTATRAGLATDQASYEIDQRQLLDNMTQLESLLQDNRFLTGSTCVTVADLLLFSFLVRFEPVHLALHKCNMHQLEEHATVYQPPTATSPATYIPGWKSAFPNLLGFGRDIWACVPGASEATAVEEISKHHWLTYGELLSGREVEIWGLGPDWWFPPLARFKRFLQAPTTGAPGGAAVAGVAGADGSNAPAAKGEFVRGTSGFRAQIGDPDFPPEKGRYHLFVANNCPWCHRATLARAVKGLQDVISVDVLAYRRDAERGWQFDESYDPEVCTPLSQGKSGGVKYIPELYEAEGSKERSVPVLYDTVAKRIVNNESAEIVRALNTAFPDVSEAAGAPDLYPAALRPLINQLNSWIYPHINNGAYRSGFASSQTAYDAAFPVFFKAMDRLERLLSTEGTPFLTGLHVTEADLRLFPTIYRFDSVYYARFRLNDRSLSAFPALKAWLDRMLEEVPGVAQASNLQHCKAGYYGRTGTGLIPVGPSEFHRLQALQGKQLHGKATEIVGSLPEVQPADTITEKSIV